MKILLITTNSAGTIYPTLPLIKGFISKGHKVDYYCENIKGLKSYEKIISETGAKYTEIPFPFYWTDYYHITRTLIKESGWKNGFRMANRFMNNPKQCIALIKTVDTKWPNLYVKLKFLFMIINYTNRQKLINEKIGNKSYDLIISDTESPGPDIAALHKKPVIIFSPEICNVQLQQSFAKVINRICTSQGDFRHLVNNYMARTYFKTMNTYYEKSYYPTTYRIYPTSKLIWEMSGVQTHFPERVIFNGNRVLSEPVNGNSRPVDEIISKGPRIFVSLGSEFSYNYTLLDAIVKALGELAHPTKIAFAGNEDSFQRYNSNPDKQFSNIEYCKYKHHQEVLSSQTDIFFCNGGASSIYEAIHYGVPMIFVVQELDHPENSEALVSNGCGLLLYDSNCDYLVDKVKDRISCVTKNYADFREHLQKSQESLKDSCDVEQTVEKVELLMIRNKKELTVLSNVSLSEEKLGWFEAVLWMIFSIGLFWFLKCTIQVGYESINFNFL